MKNKVGRPPVDDPMKTHSICMPQSLMDVIDERAEALEISRSAMLRIYLRKGIELYLADQKKGLLA